MAAPPRVICLGIAVLDRVYEVAAIPPEPVKIVANAYREGGGGMAATAAVAVAALGGRAEYWGRLGDDAAGEALLTELGRRAVGTTAVRRVSGGRSPSAAVIVDAQGERMIAAFGGGELADDDAGWLPLEQVAAAGAVLGDCRWPQGALALFATARAAGVPSVLDADLAPPECLHPLVGACDHAIFSARGLSAFTGIAAPEEGLAAVARQTDALVGVTLGRDGVMWRERGEVHRRPGHAVAVSDTTGAGDTFHGAYALALAEGGTPDQAAAFACAAAALKCRNGAGWSGMPDRPAVNAIQKETTDATLGR